MLLTLPSPRLVTVIERDPRVANELAHRLWSFGLRAQIAHTQTHGLHLARRAYPSALYVSQTLMMGNAGDLICLLDRDPRFDEVPILVRVDELDSVWALAMRRGGIQTVHRALGADTVAARLERMSRCRGGGLRGRVNRQRRLHPSVPAPFPLRLVGANAGRTR